MQKNVKSVFKKIHISKNRENNVIFFHFIKYEMHVEFTLLFCEAKCIFFKYYRGVPMITLYDNA